MTSTAPGEKVGCGDVVGPVQVGPVAHGGHCVARYHGRVIFTRHALPGERVMITLTATDRGSYWRGDATQIIEASPDRVTPRCEIAGPGGCGGCDFQHVALPAQRRLKAHVLAEQLHRLAGIDTAVEVEAPDAGNEAPDAGNEAPDAGDEAPDAGDEAPDAGDSGTSPEGGLAGFGWRTRMRYRIDEAGYAGLHAYRSDRIVALPEAGCRIAHPALARPQAVEAPKDPGSDLIGVHTGDVTHWFTPAGTAPTVTQRAIGRDWQVPGDGFWQVHPGAPELLAGAVLDGLAPQTGETALDLYCGVGLFAGALADAGCRVTAVDSSRAAIAHARRNLRDTPTVRLLADRVDRAMRRTRGNSRAPNRADLVVLDPPRSGAGRSAIEQLARRRPRAIAYVACDPAALARDLGYLAGHGYRPGRIRAFDLFPMTQHLEAVAIVKPQDADTAGSQ